MARRSPIALLAVLAACAPEGATEQSGRVNDLYDFFAVVAAAIFVLVTGLIGWSIIRYRARATDEGEPPQIHTNVKLEVTWFAIPTVIVVVLFILSTGVLGDLDNDDNLTAGGRELVVEVDSFQWGWRFDYGDGVVIESLPEAPAEIRLPVGRPVTFELTSADVVHSFYVPRFLVKRDAIPGRTNTIEVLVMREGVFGGVCAEFCGLLHNEMDFNIIGVDEQTFEAWLESVREEG